MARCRIAVGTMTKYRKTISVGRWFSATAAVYTQTRENGDWSPQRVQLRPRTATGLHLLPVDDEEEVE